MSDPLPKPRSSALVDGASRAGARAMLRACGLRDEDFKKPLIGVANTWIEIGPCNYHLRELAQHVKNGHSQSGGTPLEFNTISISDASRWARKAMRTSLISREVITDSIELVARGNLFERAGGFGRLRQNDSRGVMSLARLNIPGLCSYAARLLPGSLRAMR